MSAMIVAHDLRRTYTMGEFEVHALRGVSFQIRRGEFVAIVGPSGSGKSTLMNMIGCLDTPTAGSYHLDGLPVERLDPALLAAVRNHKIGFVFQQFHLLARSTALENVALPLAYRGGIPTSERFERAAAALTRVGLGDRMGHKPQELSGGQQQRVAIARALVSDPALLLADEPTGALDTRTSAEIMGLFADLNRSGMTVVIVTHEPDVARQAHRLLEIRDGHLVRDLATADAWPDEAHVQKTRSRRLPTRQQWRLTHEHA
ncbi:ABC transporter ATP-binding protein [Oscillochloris sp. ZM17-4]|uniref:ABC transporter ATP-binding protein n=1 Tax=Oscillochloris sp. ZM17-4 TaxID=2866714 RepID=UPI00272E26E3|nr:ABC transporter ATP-binding protein [Oscillochloris sp. ZM17-4]